jgi:phospholipid/cholesterol/gamma-HCH transport system permease protein
VGETDTEPISAATAAQTPVEAFPGARPWAASAGKPLREVGGFFALSLDIAVQMVRPPFAWR